MHCQFCPPFLEMTITIGASKLFTMLIFFKMYIYHVSFSLTLAFALKRKAVSPLGRSNPRDGAAPASKFVYKLTAYLSIKHTKKSYCKAGSYSRIAKGFPKDCFLGNPLGCVFIPPFQSVTWNFALRLIPSQPSRSGVSPSSTFSFPLILGSHPFG